MSRDTNETPQDRFLDDNQFINGRIYERGWAKTVEGALPVYLKYREHVEALPAKIAAELKDRIVCGTIDLFVQSLTTAVKLSEAYPQFELLRDAPKGIAEGVQFATSCHSNMAAAVTGVLKLWPDLSEKVSDLIAGKNPYIAEATIPARRAPRTHDRAQPSG